MSSRLQNIKKDFSKLFRGRKGDLIYGLREQRTRYIDHYNQQNKKRQTGLKLKHDNDWWAIDQYNNTYGIQVLLDQAILDNIVQEDTVSRTIGTVQGKVRHTEFLQKMLKTKRRNPYETLERFEHDGDAMILYEGTIYDEEEPMMTKKGKAMSDRSIRRACKFGLEYVANVHAQHGSRIHFILDGLDMDNVIKKRKVTLRNKRSNHIQRVFVPITYSELRNVYRKWPTSDFNETIYFYDNFKHVKAPWEQNPSAWKKYSITRMAKYRTTLEKLLKDDDYYCYRMEIQELLAAANLAEKGGQLTKSTNLLKTSVDLLKDYGNGTLTATQIRRVKNLSGKRINIHLKRAIKKYDKKRFTRKSKASKEACTILKLLLRRGNSMHILNALHHYLEIAPSTMQSGNVIMGASISHTGRLHRVLEAEYLHYRYNIINGMFNM